MKRLISICSLLATAIFAQAPSTKLNDPFLDRFVGEWHATRTFPNRPAAENIVHAQWTLNHQWIELQYRDVAVPAKYEADVFIGFDAAKKRYVCHWMDNFGGSESSLGWGTIDDKLLSLEIKFDNGELTNRFTFDPQTKSWTSLIRQVEHGEWKTFCEDKFVGTDAKK